MPTRTPTPAHTGSPSSEGERFVAISSGSFHTCALRSNGEPVCWGADPVEGESGLLPIAFGQASTPPGERFKSISSGGFHTCGLRKDGTVVCWGLMRDDWPAGTGSIIPGTPPMVVGQTPPPEGEVFVSVSSGGGHTCGLREDGTVACWGNDVRGQASPPRDERFASVTSGSYHTCGLRDDDTAVCWGPEPYRVEFESWAETPDTRFAWIDAGNAFTCGQSLDGGEVVCWGGWWDSGQWRRNPSNSDRFIAFSAGGAHSCGLRTDRTAVCQGVLDDVWHKDYVWMGRRQFASISSGVYHTCAIEEERRTIVCWGDDDYGQSSPPNGERLEGPEPAPDPP